MSNIIAEDEFNPKKIADEMIKRCLDAREWIIKCYVQEEWFINGVVPFTISMKDGVYTCKVIASTKLAALKKVEEYMPVIKFIEEDNNE
jgi:hypothetical protein